MTAHGDFTAVNLSVGVSQERSGQQQASTDTASLLWIDTTVGKENMTDH